MHPLRRPSVTRRATPRAEHHASTTSTIAPIGPPDGPRATIRFQEVGRGPLTFIRRPNRQRGPAAPSLPLRRVVLARRMTPRKRRQRGGRRVACSSRVAGANQSRLGGSLRDRRAVGLAWQPRRTRAFSTPPPRAWTPPSAGERQSARWRIGLKPNEQAAGRAFAAPRHDQRRAALRRTEGRDCLCPVAAAVHGSVDVVIVAASLAEGQSVAGAYATAVPAYACKLGRLG